jgi:hypothetical protein
MLRHALVHFLPMVMRLQRLSPYVGRGARRLYHGNGIDARRSATNRRVRRAEGFSDAIAK